MLLITQTMMRLKNAKSLDRTTESILENAFYQCKPPERAARVEEVIPPLHQYVLHLFTELTDDNCEDVLKQVCGGVGDRCVAPIASGSVLTCRLAGVCVCVACTCSCVSCRGRATTPSSR